MCTLCVQRLYHSSWGHLYTLCLSGLKISTRVSNIHDQSLIYIYIYVYSCCCQAPKKQQEMQENIANWK